MMMQQWNKNARPSCMPRCLPLGAAMAQVEEKLPSFFPLAEEMALGSGRLGVVQSHHPKCLVLTIGGK